MVRLDAWGRYRGPFGPDPKKSRAAREAELQKLADNEDGRGIILSLWNEANGTPPGTITGIGTAIKGQMIPEILTHEYPNG